MTSKGQRSNYGTQRNHIIPMSHMRNFARDIHDRDVVYLYDLEEAGREQSYSPQQLTVGNAAVQRGFYTNEYESKLVPSQKPVLRKFQRFSTFERYRMLG